MNFGTIKNNDIANGIGVRVSLFVSGCRRHCKNCFNKETWDFQFGSPFTSETLNLIINYLEKPYIKGFSLLGGEPFEAENQEVLVNVLKKIKELFPKKDIWCYTGHTLDKELSKGGSRYTSVTDEMLSYIDVLVDGEFIEEKKDVTLKFRGSSNQRLIDMNKTRLNQKITLLNL